MSTTHMLWALCLGSVKVIAQIISTASYCRSHHNGLLAQQLGIYLRHAGCPVRAYEVMHRQGVIPSYQWSCNAISAISKSAMKDACTEACQYPNLWLYDNVQIPHHVSEQRIDNQNQFDSGLSRNAWFAFLLSWILRCRASSSSLRDVSES